MKYSAKPLSALAQNPTFLKFTSLIYASPVTQPLSVHSPASPYRDAISPPPMASKNPLRTFVTTASSSLRAQQPARRVFSETSACAFSTSTSKRISENDSEGYDRPRWQQTPARMIAPFRTRPLPKGPVFKVNEDPRRLDDVYIRMLGPNGDKLLSEEVKWLAVTHKSFDHGRRGHNDRLAFLGMLESRVGD